MKRDANNSNYLSNDNRPSTDDHDLLQIGSFLAVLGVIPGSELFSSSRNIDRLKTTTAVVALSSSQRAKERGSRNIATRPEKSRVRRFRRAHHASRLHLRLHRCGAEIKNFVLFEALLSQGTYFWWTRKHELNNENAEREEIEPEVAILTDGMHKYI